MGAMTAPAYGHLLRPRWMLEEGIWFLNHGSYGAAPRAVLDGQSDWRAGERTRDSSRG